MVYSIAGKIVHKEPFLFDIKVLFNKESSLAFEIYVPLPLYEKFSEGEDIALYIYTHFQENNITLYGFLTAEEREIFRKIISVSGIGPKVGLQILSSYDVEQLRRTIEVEDVSSLSRIKGVGKKRAGLLILELKQKLPSKITMVSRIEEEALNALLNLGLTRKEAETFLQRVRGKKWEKTEDLLQVLLKEAGFTR